MRVAALGFGLLLAAGTLPAAAEAGVRVDFLDPQRYTDAGLRGRWRIGLDDPLLADLRQYLTTLGSRYLKPGEVLAIEVLDLDLAGRYETWRPAAREVRVMRDDTVPRIVLRYALLRDGQAPRRGQETVSDLAYLTRAGGRTAGDPLYFEKAMLDDWFRDRFAAGRR